MKLKKTAVAAAVVTALAMGAAGQASASVYAGSRLLVEDLTITVNNTNPGTAISGYTFTTSATAKLNNNPETTQTLTCGTISGPACTNISPILSSYVSDGNPGLTTDFTFNPISEGNNYAGSAAQIDTAELIQFIPTSTNQISEIEISGSGIGTTNTSLSSTSIFSFNFAVAAGGQIELKFDADPNLYVAIDTDNLEIGTAKATISASFNLTSDDGVDVAWSPDGQAGGFTCEDALGTIACQEVADSRSLNRTLTLPTINPGARAFSDGRPQVGGLFAPVTDLGFESFEFLVSGLAAGQYTFTGTFTTFAEAEQRVAQVPEPGTLLLLGVGLAGLGFLGKRRRREDTQA